MTGEERIRALRKMPVDADWGDKFYAAVEALEQVVDGNVIARPDPPHVVMARLIEDVRALRDSGWSLVHGDGLDPYANRSEHTRQSNAGTHAFDAHCPFCFFDSIDPEDRDAKAVHGDGLREALTDDVMREALMVLPPPPDFAAYASAVRERILAALRGDNPYD